MTEHYDEELFSLLSGELGREETTRVVSHLRECGTCTSELITVAVAFGSLRAARRAEGELRHSQHVDEVTVSVTPPDQPPLVVRPTKRRPSLQLAAAAVLVVGGIGALGLAIGQSSNPVVAAAVLHRMDAPAAVTGQVTVRAADVSRQMDVTTVNLPAAPANHFYEVWLLQPATNKMLPVGVLPPSGHGTYAVATAIVSQYSAVDISLQDNNGVATHSNVSVLRGSVLRSA